MSAAQLRIDDSNSPENLAKNNLIACFNTNQVPNMLVPETDEAWMARISASLYLNATNTIQTKMRCIPDSEYLKECCRQHATQLLPDRPLMHQFDSQHPVGLTRIVSYVVAVADQPHAVSIDSEYKTYADKKQWTEGINVLSARNGILGSVQEKLNLLSSCRRAVAVAWRAVGETPSDPACIRNLELALQEQENWNTLHLHDTIKWLLSFQGRVAAFSIEPQSF